MYEILKESIKPELLILIPVLYLFGMALKQSAVFPDKYIPLLIGCASVLLTSLYVFATTNMPDVQTVCMGTFCSITQGVLCAGASVYVNQLIKQTGK